MRTYTFPFTLHFLKNNIDEVRCFFLIYFENRERLGWSYIHNQSINSQHSIQIWISSSQENSKKCSSNFCRINLGCFHFSFENFFLSGLTSFIKSLLLDLLIFIGYFLFQKRNRLPMEAGYFTFIFAIFHESLLSLQ